MIETFVQVMRMLLPLVVAVTTGLAIYNINRLVILSVVLRKMLVAAIALVVAPMVVAPFLFDVIPLSKLTLAYLMFLACVICWTVFFIAPQGRQTLIMIEMACAELRDVSMLGATQARAQLSAISERLKLQAEPDQRQATAMVLKSVSPLVMLFFAKEKSMLKWGMTAFSLGRSMFKYFGAHKKNEA
jgi:hypothetical protein